MDAFDTKPETMGAKKRDFGIAGLLIAFLLGVILSISGMVFGSFIIGTLGAFTLLGCVLTLYWTARDFH